MSRKKILVVDDDPDILKVLQENLRLEDYEVLTASTGEEALRSVGRQAPDLIVLDLMLPDLDGLQVCRRLRKESDVPIIMLTARDRVSDRVLGLETGADDYVVKPFDTLELLARVRACLRRSKGQVRDQVQVEDLRVDLRQREVWLKGNPIRLTFKEFELLQSLVSHAGEAMSRDSIRQHAWKDASLYDWSRTIDMHVQRLRQKLEKDPENPRYILTVPGVGYKFRSLD
jgi:DNA-binding response OmpR family regulator